MVKLCVIGDPVAHSLSPSLHLEFLKNAGLKGSYEAVTVREGELSDFVRRAKAGAYDGFNVTMPHKQAIVPLLDEMAPSAAAFDAVNTVVVRDGRAIGHNTDGDGFVASLPSLPERPLLLGYGGAAKAVEDALLRRGVNVMVCARHPLSGQHPWEELTRLASACDLLINATPLGMTGKGQFRDFTFLEYLPPQCTVYDLVYEPQQTELLRRASALGHDTIGGLALLRAQAELAFRLFIE